MESSVEASQPGGISGPKPALAPKPRLAPKPFSLQKNTTIRSIHAPKTSKPTAKAESINVPKPSQSTLAWKSPQPASISDSKPSPVGAHTKTQPRTTRASKVGQHKEDTLESSVGKSDPASQTTPPKQTSKSEPIQKDDVVQANLKVDTATNSEQKHGKEQGSETPAPVAQNREESGSDGSSTTTPTYLWSGSRKRLSSELTSMFESSGLPLPPQPNSTISSNDTKDNSNKPVSSNPDQSQATSALPNRASDEDGLKEDYTGGTSIKRRISLLFDSSSRPEVMTKREEPEIINGTQGVKERIKNWAAETSSDTEKKPQVLPRTRSRSFEPASAPVVEKTPKMATIKPPAKEMSSGQDDPTDQLSKVSPAEQPTERETSTVTPGDQSGVKLRNRSRSLTHTNDGDSAGSAELTPKRNNVKRRSVRFGTVERDDGGPPLILGSASESSTEEEDEAPENETKEDVPVPVPAYRRVGVVQSKDDEIQGQEEEERLKHLEFEKRRRAEEHDQAKLKLEEERRQEEEREKEIERQREELRLREEEKQREMLKEQEEMDRRQKEAWERERLKEEEREMMRLREEEMERERQVELMQRQREEQRERAKQIEERLKRDQEERERERLKEEQRQQERLREERERQREEESRLMQQHKEHSLEGKLREDELNKEKEREEEWENEWLKTTGSLRGEEQQRERAKELELMWQRQKEEDRERARQAEEKERQRLREEAEEREMRRRLEQEERMREQQRQEEERRRRELERRMQQEKEEEMERLRQLENQREEERRRQIERVRAEELERKKKEEMERMWEMERQREEERRRELERRVQQEKEEEMERLRQLENQREEEKRRQIERVRAEELERKKKEEMERMWEMERQREEERRRALERRVQQEKEEMERLRQLENQREEERRRQSERVRLEELERKKKEEEMERMWEMERQREEEKRREYERRVQQEKEEMERLRQIEKQREEERRRHIEKERAEELERKMEVELKNQSDDEIKEMLRREEEQRRRELWMTSEKQESAVDKAEQSLISFESDNVAQMSKSPHSPSPKAYKPTESLIDVVYDDFSVRKPTIEVDFDDFSVKPKLRSSQPKAETAPVTHSWAADLMDTEETEMLVPLDSKPQESKAPEQEGKPDSLVPTSTWENPEETVKDEKERPEEKQLISFEVEEETERKEEEEVEIKEDIGEEEDEQEAQVNSYHINDEDKDTNALIDSEPRQLEVVYEQPSESDSPKLVPDEVPEVSSEDVDSTDFQKEPELAPFPESTTPLLDTSALRSKADVGRRRSRSRPSRSFRAVLDHTEIRDWRVHDSTDEKEASLKQRDSDSEEEQPKAKVACTPPSSQRVPMLPGLSPAALIAQLKRRTAGGGTGGGGGEETEENKAAEEKESQNEEAASSPSQLSRSPRSAAHLAGAARVLPPLGVKDGGAISSPAWLKELKSKKRLSQHDSDV